jgi:HEAT repeat protein/S1-C subfamily serine protease
MISFNCSGCHTTLEVPDSKSGSKVNCPECGKALLIPAGSKARGQPEKPPSSRRQPGPERTEKSEPERSRRSRLDGPGDTRPRRKKAKRSFLVPGAIIASVAVILAAGGGLWWYLGSEDKLPQASVKAAAAPQPELPPSTGPAEASPAGTLKRLNNAGLVTKPVAAAVSTPEKSPASDQLIKEVYQHILKSTSVIYPPAGNNQATQSTGVLIDAKNRWVLTDFRISRPSEGLILLFPKLKRGESITDNSKYQIDKLAESDLVAGKVIKSDQRRCITLVEIDRIPEGILPLPVAQRGVRTGERVHFVANPTSPPELWVGSTATVRALSDKTWSINLNRTKFDFSIRAVETQPPPSSSDGGGPAVNDKGELVGIALGGDRGGQPNACVDIVSILDLVRDWSNSLKVEWVRATRKVAPLVPPIDVPALVRKLNDPSDSVRALAAEEIGKLESDGRAAIPELVKRLPPESGSMTHRAAQAALLKMGAPEKTELGFLSDALKSQSTSIRAYAASGLAQLGPDALPALPALLEAGKDNDSAVRAAALRALGRMGPGSKDVVFPVLAAALKDKDDRLHGAAAEGIASVGALNAGDLPLLREMLKDKNPDVRASALNGIGKLGRAARPALSEVVEAFKSPDLGVRRSATGAVFALNGDAKSAFPVYIQAIEDSDSEERRIACNGLAAVGLEAKESVPALQKRLNDPDREVRLAAALALAKFGASAKEAAPSLVTLAQDNDRDIRSAALAALSGIGPGARNAVDGLISLLPLYANDKDGSAAIIGVLASVGKEAVGPLTQALRNEDKAIRLGAVKALGKIGPPAKPSRNVLNQLGRMDKDEEVQRAIIASLNSISAKSTKQ